MTPQPVELEKFVKEALCQIMRGVEGAAADLSTQTGVEISPRLKPLVDNFKNAGVACTQNDKVMTFIEFDVAVTALHKEGNQTGVGVVAGIFGIGTQEKSDLENQTVSRISFRVPVGFPGR